MESRFQVPIVDVENPETPLATSIRRKLDTLSPLSSECCIYRVPERLRCTWEKAYTPQVVSIGPLHHGKDGLKAMEEHKMRYLRDYIRRTNVSLEDYLNIVKDNEQKLRSCYAESIAFSSDEFVKIILVDSAFIIEVLLRKCIGEFQEEENDRIFKKPWISLDVFLELGLLENQLPFFILKELFDPNKIKLPPDHEVEELSIIKFSCKLFIPFLSFEGTEENPKEIMSSTTILHFVDLMRYWFVPEKPREREECQGLTIPSMTELHQAGVKFKARSGKHLLDIDFVNGILGIPRLTLHGQSESYIRNVVAFEQCHYLNDSYLSHYLMTLDRLVNTPKDVELLVKHRIVNSLGDYSETATIINKLASGVQLTPNEFYFANIFNDLNAYYNRPWHKWKANLVQNYFNTPWATISVIAAVFVIVLTFIQAVCSIISVT